MKFGYLRETQTTKNYNHTYDTEVISGLDEYLKIIFPHINDWVHDKTVPNSNCKKRPDYRSEQLKMIVEFDGLPHYLKPDKIINDIQAITLYTSLGYKVVRIPYFIQLTNKAVKTLFGINVKQPLFDENIPSLIAKDCCTPAYLCIMGIERMAKDFKNFPEQYKVNMESMKKEDFNLTRWDLLEKEYEKVICND